MKEVQKAVIRRGDKYLLIRRLPGAKYFPEYWDFPGGKFEAGEEPRTSIEREITEETGLTANALDVVGTHELDLDGAGSPTHRFTIYETESFFGEVRIDQEHTDYRWMTKDEILNLKKIEPYVRAYFEKRRA
jgi:8-oxo-dGTP diphosphatase